MKLSASELKDIKLNLRLAFATAAQTENETPGDLAWASGFIAKFHSLMDELIDYTATENATIVTLGKEVAAWRENHPKDKYGDHNNSCCGCGCAPNPTIIRDTDKNELAVKAIAEAERENG